MRLRKSRETGNRKFLIHTDAARFDAMQGDTDGPETSYLSLSTVQGEVY
jgi:hypothetical protein